MLSFPELNSEDFGRILATLDDLRMKTEASRAMLVEKAGYLIAHSGETDFPDRAELATLAANAFAATQRIATGAGNTCFNCMFQEGDVANVLWRQVDDTCLVVLIFPAKVGVGYARYYSNITARAIEDILDNSRRRQPGIHVDLSNINPHDIAEVFKMK
jgi:predicted regulator of Ras-like GTPase activity (Roadblock/LC7/MglB family)